MKGTQVVRKKVRRGKSKKAVLRQPELWEKYKRHLQLSNLTRSRIKKLFIMFVTTERGLKVDFEKVERKDIDAYLYSLHDNDFRKKNGEVFSSSTKVDLKKFLKLFFKWLRGNNEFFPPEVAWIKTSIAKDDLPIEKEVLNIKEVRKLAYSFDKPLYRYLTLLLFDSGFRISEMLSVRKKDFTWEKYDEKQRCFWIECRISKTVVRKVPVPLFTDELRMFITSPDVEELNSNDSLFPCQYFAYLKQLKIRAKVIFEKKVTPHCLRHSSATYYSKAFEGNMNLIADRFGWTFNSKELQTYIRRSGAYQRPQAKKIFSNELGEVKEENDVLKGKVERLEKLMDSVYNNFIESGKADEIHAEYEKAEGDKRG